MKIEEQVCTLEQAKKLDYLGVFQESSFYWNTFLNRSSTTPDDILSGLDEDHSMNLDDDGDEKSYIKFHRWYSAFTVAELGVLIDQYNPEIEFKRGVAYCCDEEIATGGTEAILRANVLIYLLEEDCLHIDNINEYFVNQLKR